MTIKSIQSSLQQYATSLPESNQAVQPLIDEYLQSVSEIPNKDNPCQAVGEIAELIPLEKLQKAVGEEALLKARDMFEQAKYYLKVVDRKERSWGLHSLYSSITEKFLTLTDSLISAFGIQGFFKEARNENEAERKSARITSLISASSVITATLLPILGVAFAGPLIGGSVIFMAAVSLIYPQIRPMPNRLPEAENWTKAAEEKSLPRGLTSKNVMATIATSLAAKKRIILTGPSRVGKTQAVKDFTYSLIEKSKATKTVRHIERVFMLNTASLVPPRSGDATSLTNRISDALGRHRKNALIVLDEFGKTCIDEKNSWLVAQLLTDLESKFDQVIALATDEEFKQLAQMHPSLKNRFTECSLNSVQATDIEKILLHTTLKEAPETLVDTSIFDVLSKKLERAHRSPKALAQPHASLQVLRRCLLSTSKTQELAEEIKVQELKNRVDYLSAKAVLEKESPEISRELIRTRAALAKSKEALNVKKRRFFELRIAQENLVALKRKMYELALKIHNLHPEKLSRRNRRDAASFLLLRRLADTMEQEIRKQGRALNVNVVIDKTIVDKAIKSELSKL